MTKTLDFIYDFGSLNAYLAYRAFPDLISRTHCEINYIPCLLGGVFKATNNQSPIMAFADIKGKIAYERIEIARFVKKHGIRNFQMNPHFPVNTLLLMRGAVVAQTDGFEASYIEAAMSAMWEQALNMSDPDIFVTAMNDAQLDGAAILERTQDDAIKQKLIENTSAAVDRGVFGMPSFFVGDEMFFGKERLGQIEEMLIS